MHCVVNRVMLAVLDHMTQPLVAYFLDSGWFDSQVKKKIFFNYLQYLV